MPRPYPLGRFTNTENGHFKFWECMEDGAGTYVTRWGKIGSKGDVKSGLSASAAQKKIDEKLRKRYRHDSNSSPSIMEQQSKLLKEALVDVPVAPAPRRARL